MEDNLQCLELVDVMEAEQCSERKPGLRWQAVLCCISKEYPFITNAMHSEYPTYEIAEKLTERVYFKGDMEAVLQ